MSEYTGLNFLQIAELDYIQYLVWRRDAFIHKLSQSDEGVKYLQNAYRMGLTKPDRAKLRDKYRKGV